MDTGQLQQKIEGSKIIFFFLLAVIQFHIVLIIFKSSDNFQKMISQEF